MGPVPQRRLASSEPADLFTEIARRDVLVHHPYDSFGTSVEAFVRAAANDENVVTVKTTVYRTSEDSAIAPALIKSSENGKQAVCVVELKARFDERRNIGWARSLEQAGVHVVYGFPDMKIHAKTTLIVRREGDELRRYVHIGTGNYHATTARIYEDVGLFTADPKIDADIAEMFNFVTGFGRPQRFRKILAAPFNLRKKLIEEIRQVAKAAEAGKHARIRIKCNSLTHAEVIAELYKASRAGASIDVIVRANCTLIPGVKGLSEKIRVRSILGRFLEHSRLYCFEADEARSYYLGSADLMPRNLDHRIEVVVPVEDTHARNELESIFKALLADNTHAWELGSDGALGAHRAGEERTPQVGTGDVHAAARPTRRPGVRVSAVRWLRHHGAMPVGVVDVGRTRCASSSRGQDSRFARSEPCCAWAPTSRRMA